MKIKIYFSLLFLSLVLLFSFCKKEKTTVFQDLELNVEVENGSYKCTWTPTNLGGFEAYRLIVSPYRINENILHFGNVEIFNFYDQSVNYFELELPPNTPEIYFQVLVYIEGRYIYSNEVEIKVDGVQRIWTLPGTPNIVHYPQKNALYLFYDEYLVMYDYQQEESIETSSFYLNNTKWAVGNNGFGEELYVANFHQGNLGIIDATTLELKETISIDGEVHSIATNEKGLIVLAVDNEIAPLQIFDRASLSVTQEYNFSDFDDVRGVCFLSKEENILIEKGTQKLNSYHLDQDGNILLQESKPNSFSPNSFAPLDHELLECSNSGSYFASTKFGHLFDQELNGLNELVFSSFNGLYRKLLFSENDEFLYFNNVITGNEFGNTRLDKVSIPDLELVQAYYYEHFWPIFLFMDDGEPMVVLYSLFGGGLTIRPIE